MKKKKDIGKIKKSVQTSSACGSSWHWCKSHADRSVACQNVKRCLFEDCFFRVKKQFLCEPMQDKSSFLSKPMQTV